MVAPIVGHEISVRLKLELAVGALDEKVFSVPASYDWSVRFFLTGLLVLGCWFRGLHRLHECRIDQVDAIGAGRVVTHRGSAARRLADQPLNQSLQLLDRLALRGNLAA